MRGVLAQHRVVVVEVVVGCEAAADELTSQRLDAHGEERAVEGSAETAVVGIYGRWDEAVRGQRDGGNGASAPGTC